MSDKPPKTQTRSSYRDTDDSAEGYQLDSSNDNAYESVIDHDVEHQDQELTESSSKDTESSESSISMDQINYASRRSIHSYQNIPLPKTMRNEDGEKEHETVNADTMVLKKDGMGYLIPTIQGTERGHILRRSSGYVSCEKHIHHSYMGLETIPTDLKRSSANDPYPTISEKFGFQGESVLRKAHMGPSYAEISPNPSEGSTENNSSSAEDIEHTYISATRGLSKHEPEVATGYQDASALHQVIHTPTQNVSMYAPTLEGFPGELADCSGRFKQAHLGQNKVCGQDNPSGETDNPESAEDSENSHIFHREEGKSKNLEFSGYLITKETQV